MQNITEAVLMSVKRESDITRVSAAFSIGLFQINLVDDPDYNFEDLCGDMFNPEVNPEIDPVVLARQKRNYRARVNRDGVYGAVMQCRATPAAEWVTLDSIWGFVGTDFVGSGYESDFVNTANDWLFANLDLPSLQNLLKDLM